MAVNLPVAVITGDAPTAVEATDLPVTVNLSAATISNFGTTDQNGSAAVGSDITAWAWYLDRPPASAAVLINGTTETPSYVMDVPGTYQARLRVTNDVGVQSEGFNVRIHPSQSPYRFTAPASAYYVTRAKLPVSSLVPPTAGSRGYATDVQDLFDYVEELGSAVATSTGAAPRTKYIQSVAGSASADGSAGAPYNPTSAAANSFAGPWAQAIAALQAIDVSADPMNPRTIYALGGGYTENPSILDADAPWTIIFHGQVNFDTTKTFTYTVVADVNQLENPHLRFSPATEGSYFITPILSIDNPTVSSWYIFARNVSFYRVEEGGSSQRGPAAYLYDSHVYSTAAFGNIRIAQAHNCAFHDDLDVRSIGRVTHGQFLGNVTVNNAADADSEIARGLVDCAFNSGVVWTGPADTANFDVATIEKFNSAGGTFTGGASTADFWAKQWTWRFPAAPVTLTNLGADTNFATVKVGVQLRSVIEIDALLSAVVHSADSFKVSLCVAPDGGTPLTTIATQSAPLYAGGSIPVIRLHAELTFTDVDASCAAYGTYRLIYSNASGDAVDEGTFTVSGFDLDPATMTVAVRAQRIGTFGASSTATLVWATVTYRAED